MALAPGIFNVNEPAIFGMPIVLNATILIPWVVAPLVVTTFNYLVMAAGLVPAPTGVSVPWTVPVIASGVLATNSWLGGLLQVIDVVLCWCDLVSILAYFGSSTRSFNQLKQKDWQVNQPVSLFILKRLPIRIVEIAFSAILFAR